MGLAQKSSPYGASGSGRALAQRFSAGQSPDQKPSPVNTRTAPMMCPWLVSICLWNWRPIKATSPPRAIEVST